MAKIKYLGTSHVRELLKGEDWNGRLSDGLSKDVRWSIDNHYLVDTEEAGLSESAVELLLEDKEFKDVSDAERIPVSAAEDLWHGVRDKSYAKDDPRVAADGTFHSKLVDGDGDEDAAKTGASATGTGTTTTGGSTTGDAGAGSRSSRGGSRAGGSPGGSTSGD